MFTADKAFVRGGGRSAPLVARLGLSLPSCGPGAHKQPRAPARRHPAACLTVRHYHHVGLLPEPGRDASGYRRYSAQAAVDLIRIKTLADAGVPLARIDAVLHAQPAEFTAAITDIDAELRRKIDQLTVYRRRIAELAGGERLVLPPEVVAVLDRMRGFGVRERTVRLERDARILIQALDPSAMRQWIAEAAPAWQRALDVLTNRVQRRRTGVSTRS